MSVFSVHWLVVLYANSKWSLTRQLYSSDTNMILLPWGVHSAVSSYACWDITVLRLHTPHLNISAPSCSSISAPFLHEPSHSILKEIVTISYSFCCLLSVFPWKVLYLCMSLTTSLFHLGTQPSIAKDLEEVIIYPPVSGSKAGGALKCFFPNPYQCCCLYPYLMACCNPVVILLLALCSHSPSV